MTGSTTTNVWTFGFKVTVIPYDEQNQGAGLATKIKNRFSATSSYPTFLMSELGLATAPVVTSNTGYNNGVIVPSPAPTTQVYQKRAKSAETTRPRAAVATLAMLPDYTGLSVAIGTIVVEDTMAGIELFGTLVNAGAGTFGDLSINSGVSCASTAAAGTPFQNGASTNPWLLTGCTKIYFILSFCRDARLTRQFSFFPLPSHYLACLLLL